MNLPIAVHGSFLTVKPHRCRVTQQIDEPLAVGRRTEIADPHRDHEGTVQGSGMTGRSGAR